MRIASFERSRPERGGRLRVSWRSRARVHRIEVWVDGKLRNRQQPQPGELSCVVDVGDVSTARMQIVAGFDGPKVSLSVTPERVDDPPDRVEDEFAARERLVDAKQDHLEEHRRLFLEFDRRTHVDLLAGQPADEVVQRRGAIERMSRWLWRRTLLRGAARVAAIDASVRGWDKNKLDADLRSLSTLMMGLLQPHDDILKDAFERFANGELLLGDASQHGGPDGAYYTSFAGFALACIEHEPPLPQVELEFWQRCLPVFVSTLHIFGANYRAPTPRTGRFADFAVEHFKTPQLDDTKKLALRTRFAPMKPPALAVEFDRWVVDNLPEEVNDLAG